MKQENLAIAVVAVIIIVAISAFLFLTFGKDLFQDDSKITIEEGDCVDVNYIGRYASNNTVFDSSYEFYENKTGAEPKTIFVTLDSSKAPPENYSEYSSDYIKGFIKGLIGLKKGETATIGPIPPEEAYGVKPKIGDLINLSALDLGIDKVYRITFIQENKSMPLFFQEEYNLPNVTTILYSLRDESFYIGMKIDLYMFWENSSSITKINETTIWMYVIPTTEINENFTYSEGNSTNYQLFTYPENTSSISFINDTIIKITHNPIINSTINVSIVYPSLGLIPGPSYTIESITADKINASTADSTGNKTYFDFDRTVTIQRNQSQEIIQPDIPGEALEGIFLQLRMSDSTFKLSYNSLSDQILYYEVEIENVYKTS